MRPLDVSTHSYFQSTVVLANTYGNPTAAYLNQVLIKSAAELIVLAVIHKQSFYLLK